MVMTREVKRTQTHVIGCLGLTLFKGDIEQWFWRWSGCATRTTDFRIRTLVSRIFSDGPWIDAKAETILGEEIVGLEVVE
jgi:hypothetical protein